MEHAWKAIRASDAKQLRSTLSRIPIKECERVDNVDLSLLVVGCRPENQGSRPCCADALLFGLTPTDMPTIVAATSLLAQ
jgi:flavodoxin